MSRYSKPNNSPRYVLTPQQANCAADPRDLIDVDGNVDFSKVYDQATVNDNKKLCPPDAVSDAHHHQTLGSCPTRNTDTTNPSPRHPASSNSNSEGTANDTDFPSSTSITGLPLLSNTNPGGTAISTNTHPRRFLSKKAVKFQDRVRRLRLYGEQHGHIGISKADDPTLYNWIRNIRSEANEFIELRRDSFPLDTAEKETLDEMGFAWETNALSTTTKHFRFIIFNIEEFRKENGHVDVFKEDVSDPRVELYQEAITFLISKKDSLSKARKAQLESLGIVLETYSEQQKMPRRSTLHQKE